MLPVDSQGFAITTLGLPVSPFMTLNVPHMPNRMRQLERIALRPIKSHRFLIVSQCGIAVTKISLNLTEVSQSSR
jgi:hypothetical protein